MNAKTEPEIKTQPGPIESAHAKSLLTPSPDGAGQFTKSFKWSATFHGGLLLIAIVASLTMPKKTQVFAPSIRVDLVGIPDITKKDLSKYQADDVADLNEKLKDAGKGAKKLLEAAKKEAEAPPAPDDTLAMKKEKPAAKDKKKDNLKSAIDRIKALQAMETEDDKPRKKVVAKGNALSKGSSLEGVPGNDSSAYISKIQGKIRDNWNLPVWLSKQDLNAQVMIILDKSGFVTSAILARTSGNKQFDDYCLKAVRMSQPFGPPPQEFVNAGLTLAFPL